MVLFFGIDLAWSARNSSGIAVIEGNAQGGRLQAANILGDMADILAFIDYYAKDHAAIIGVDAPLWVPNEAGRRPAEAEIGQAFRRYEAGAHPANRRLLSRDGVVRGEALVQELAQRSFVHRPAIEAGVAVRQVTEIFPHPSMVAIFQLERTLKYKARPKRRLDERWEAWRTYQTQLRKLASGDPALRGQQRWLDIDPEQLRGAALKRYEDVIDAIFCAYIGLYAFRWGAERCRVFGTMEAGYIFSAVPPELRVGADGS